MQEGLKKILYVDDEHINLELFKINFRNDYQVLTADSAQKGLELISSDAVNVVISDLKMPGMNGIEFIERIKQNPPRRSVSSLLPTLTRCYAKGHKRGVGFSLRNQALA
jgi:CheY-like chemotaxis protein